ncbi:MAG: GerW family sporulation protein [Bacillota bacterium]|nr:GerW family sporulation protein [Bacillota bacterium]
MDNTHPIDSLMNNTMEKIKTMIDVNTIVGNAVEAQDGTLIIPISKVTFGFTSGGAEYGKEVDSKFPFGGGAGAGVSIKPVAFLVIKSDSTVRLMSMETDNPYDKIIDTIPQVADIIKKMINSKEKEKNQKCESENKIEEIPL